GCGTTNDHTVPRPLITCHVESIDWQLGHIGLGGKRSRPHDAHFCMRSSPARQPSQKPVESSSNCGSSIPSDMDYLRSNSALVGTPSPDVTRQVSAPGTCAVDVPRICRTPSTMRLNPCT